MIDVYKSRLETADWLAPATREKAITKLNVITPHIGYPEKPETYDKKIIDENLLVGNAQNLAKISIAYAWSKWNKPVDRSEWQCTCQLIWLMLTMIHSKIKLSFPQVYFTGTIL